MRLFFVVATREPEDELFKKTLEPTMKESWLKNTIRVYKGSSIFEKYNLAVDILLERFSLEDSDIVIFLHNDIAIKDQYFEEKLQMVFERRSDIGLVGVYGTTQFEDKGAWWLCDRSLYGRGNILQRFPNGLIGPMTDLKGFFDDIVSLDGCIMALRGSLAKKKLWDSQTFKGYHMYDSDFCFEVLDKTSFKIAVADILVFHDSPGMPPNMEEWNENVSKLNSKWTSKGYSFPLTVKSFGR